MQKFGKDKELAKALLAGDKRELRQFLKAHRPRIHSFILRYAKSLDEADEILQETLLSALDSLPLYSGKATLYTWFCAIAKHEVSDFYRKKRIKSVLFSHFPKVKTIASEALGPEEILEKKELSEKVKRTLSSLGEGYKTVLRLKYQEGKSVAQIGQELGESVKAVESRLFRARQAFIKVYANENGKHQ